MDIRALAELFMVAVFAVWLAILTVFMAHSLICHIRNAKRAWEREIAEDAKSRKVAFPTIGGIGDSTFGPTGMVTTDLPSVLPDGTYNVLPPMRSQLAEDIAPKQDEDEGPDYAAPLRPFREVNERLVVPVPDIFEGEYLWVTVDLMTRKEWEALLGSGHDANG